MSRHALAAKHAPPLCRRGALRRPHIQVHVPQWLTAAQRNNQANSIRPAASTHDLLPAGGLIYVSGGDLKHRNGSDVYYKFRPSSHFVYLTGATEPGFACLLDPASARFTLVAPKPHEDAEL